MIIFSRKTVFLATILLLLFRASVQAASVGNEARNYGGACTTDKANGADWDTIFQCKNGTWQRAPYFFGTSADSCDAMHAGIVQWAGTALQVCNGTAWTAVGSSGGKGLSLSGGTSAKTSVIYNVTTLSNTLLASTPTTSQITIEESGSYYISATTMYCGSGYNDSSSNAVYVNGASVLTAYNGYNCNHGSNSIFLPLNAGDIVRSMCNQNAGWPANCYFTIIKL